MKNNHLLLILSLLGVVFSLTLPYSQCVIPSCDIVFYGYQYPLAYVSVLMLLLVTIVSFVKRSVTISLLGLLFALSNFFFTIFLMVFVSFYNDGLFDSIMELGSGVYLNLIFAVFILVIGVIDIYKSYKKKEG